MGNDDRGARPFCLPVKFVFALGGVIMDYFKGKKIPEGATHFWEFEGIFCKKINGHWCFFVHDCWDLNISADNFGFESNFIELPTQPIGQSYMPKVGDVCELKNNRQDMPVDSRWVKAFFVGLSKDGHKIMEIDASTSIVWLDESDGDAFVFRPLKTEAEKQAEAIYELVKDATDLYAACEILVAAGYSK